MCGDYSVNTNTVTQYEVYLVLKTEDIMATLNGGQKFSKIDLSQAYQQLELDEESQQLLTTNTHKALFRPTRLQFGLHSAAGIFQRELEKRLAGIPRTVLRVDDILVTSENDQEHLSNVEVVLIVKIKKYVKSNSKVEFPI